MLAKTYSEDVDPVGWFMSEKLDGLRCYWNGSTMYTRNGNKFYPPKWFIENFPKYPLDGELFLSRGKFSETSSITRKQYAHDGWNAICYVVFDAPTID
jgi:DNA ligase-1